MHLRPANLYAALMRPVEVRTRRSGRFRFYEVVTPSDVFAFDITSRLPDFALASDSTAFRMVTSGMESVSTADSISVAVGGIWGDSASSLDVVRGNIGITFRESVTVSSSIGISFGPFTGSCETATVSDKALFGFKSGVGSVSLASDAVVFGMRYLIDCFYGGISFSGCPFGGRIL